ncbi:MAG: CHAP domain-containing protein [Fimbriimonadaceae bacterium]|nr:CHAP domain-containing protein [Fimbriimonadaceae bacterium]
MAIKNSKAVAERSLILAAHDADQRRVRERGANRGQEVAQYLKTVGLGPGYPWCAAFVAHHWLAAGGEKNRLPLRPASVCSWVRSGGFRVTNDPGEVRRADAFAWCRDNGTGHMGFIVQVIRTPVGVWIRTIEGNTNAAGSRDGDGVYRRTRRWTKNMKGILLTRDD